MCFDAGTSHSVTTTAAPHHAGCKRPREEQPTVTLALFDPSATEQQRANAAENAGALVLYVPSREPISAVPLAVVAPRRLAAPDVLRAEPPWLRKELLPQLGFRSDLPVHFVDEKVVTANDLDRHQNRFRLPNEGVIRNLRPVLSVLERMAANLLHEEASRPPRLPKLPMIEGEEGPCRKKRKGKKHGGLPVLVIVPFSGIWELQLSRWDSSGGTVIKGEGYLQFINDCNFKVDDVVEIWAFKENYFRLFGVDYCQESSQHLLITKKGQMLPSFHTERKQLRTFY